MADASRDPRVECCGLLAGRDGVITTILRAENAAANPEKNYEIAPQELFALMRRLHEENLDLIAIYHSHPNGKNEPSPTDIEQGYYPDAAFIILSPEAGAERPVRAFQIRDGHATDLSVQII